MTRPGAFLAARSPRERALLGAAAALAALVTIGGGGLVVRDDLAALRARVAGRERQLAEVRRLAGALRTTGALMPAATEGPLVARLEAAALGVVGRERLAAMEPATEALDGGVIERVTLRVGDTSLADGVRLLHALESDPGLRVTRVELRKHPDDPTRFEVALEAVAPRGAP